MASCNDNNPQEKRLLRQPAHEKKIDATLRARWEEEKSDGKLIPNYVHTKKNKNKKNEPTEKNDDKMLQ